MAQKPIVFYIMDYKFYRWNMDIENNSYLDNLAQEKGAEKCKEEFYQICLHNKKEAVRVINDPRLNFSTFYILLPLVNSFWLFPYLNSRNSMAIDLIKQILNRDEVYGTNDPLSIKNDSILSVLLWMVETGYNSDCITENYEEIMDIAVSILINIYNNKKILPIVAKMIFSRNRKGGCINYLVWAFFESKDIDAIKLVAKYLRSDDEKDFELAKKLLHIEDSINDKEKFYHMYIDWLSQNDPFLYFTEESNQFSSEPVPIKTDNERKYLNKGIPSYKKQPLSPSNKEEEKCIAVFSTLNEDEQYILSEYSNKIHKDKAKWKKWLNSPVEEQLEQAKSELKEDSLL